MLDTNNDYESKSQAVKSDEIEKNNSILKENKDLLFADFTMINMTTEIIDNELIFKFT